MSNLNFDDNFKDSLDMLCTNLITFLNETENLLSIEKEKYNQVKSVYNPWPVKRRKSLENTSDINCTCTKSEITAQSTSNNLDTSLVESIPKIVSKTKALRINPSKTSIKFVDAKSTIKKVISTKSKPEVISVKSSKSNIRMKNNKSSTSLATTLSKNTSLESGQTHSPSCKLYSLGTSTITIKKTSYTNLSEAVSAYGVPSTLQKTLEDYYSFIFDSDKINDITRKARSAFLKGLTKQNEEEWMEASNQLESLPKYMSVVCSIQEKVRKKYELPCIIYRNINELVQYENKKFEKEEKEMWSKIIEYINKQLIPVLLNADLTVMEKIYISKMLKTVCNFSKSRVPNVPVYLLE